MTAARCRGCGADLVTVFCDLGVSPLANSYVPPERVGEMEPFFPLKALACDRCLLVQLQEHASPEAIFRDYAYFSSWSSSWVEHARRFASSAIDTLGLGSESLVVEVASNDGYLLQWFAGAGIDVLGVEPAQNVAAVAIERGIPTVSEFFGAALAAQLAARRRADLIVGNNVLAHVPDLHDFVEGVSRLLAPGGSASFEFPHLLELVRDVQFDTIYHEHFSYFSLVALLPVLESHGLRAVDVAALPTHGGSLRLTLAHHDDDRRTGPAVGATLAAERAAGLHDPTTYSSFGGLVAERKRRILEFLLPLADERLLVAGYGAPAKGNTLLNHCGIGPDLLAFTVDANPEKQGRLLPGTRIPVYDPGAIDRLRPDVVVLLPWNLEAELVDLLSGVRARGTRLAVLQPVPRFLG